jgi:hypothetical protein
VPEITVELAVGDVLRIGNRTLTVIDIEGSEVHFRVDDDPSQSPEPFAALPNSIDARALRQKAK